MGGYYHPDMAGRGHTLGLEPPDPDVDNDAADPKDLISPTLGCAPARISVVPTVSVLANFHSAFLIAAKVSRLKSFSSTLSDLREASVSPANATGV